MWRRHVLFWGICLAGAATAGSVVLPTRPADLPARAADDGAATVAAAVDAALARVWQSQGIVPAAAADDLAVLRRLHLALTGAGPSLEEVRRFESLSAPARLDMWLDGILADRRYADYVAERLARATVGVEDGPFLLFRRRRFVSWLSDCLAENMPHDELVRRLIADSGLWTDTPSTNFITVNIKPDSDEEPDPKRLAARVSRAMLGVRLDCAECHDHPFADWKQQDFHSLAAFFGQTRRSFGVRDGDGVYMFDDPAAGRREPVVPRVPFAEHLLPEDGSRRARLAAWVTHPQNVAFARATANRAWALLFGRPLVEPIDDVPADGDAAGVLKLLASDFVEHSYDWRRLLRVIAATRAMRLSSEPAAAGAEEAQAVWAAFPITRLRPEQVAGAIVQADSLTTIDHHSHILVRIARDLRRQGFIKRYGDAGADEFDPAAGTIPQRLLMLNGELVASATRGGGWGSAASRIAQLAASGEKAIETAYLAVLTRRPAPAEQAHFTVRLEAAGADARGPAIHDLYWTLLNSTEFSWNH